MSIHAEIQESNIQSAQPLSEWTVSDLVALVGLAVAVISLCISWLNRRYLIPQVILRNCKLTARQIDVDAFIERPDRAKSQGLHLKLDFNALNIRGGGGGFSRPELVLKQRKYWFTPAKIVASVSARAVEYETQSSGTQIEIVKTTQLPGTFYLQGGEVLAVELDYDVYDSGHNGAVSAWIRALKDKSKNYFWAIRYTKSRGPVNEKHVRVYLE